MFNMDPIQSTDSTKNNGPAKTWPGKQIIHTAIQLTALAILLFFCYNVLSPFINPLLWAGIFAVALYPLHQKFKKILKGRGTLAAVLLTLAILIVFILPGVMIVLRTASEAKGVFTEYKAGNITIPAPGENVKTWPLVGNKVYAAWQDASTDLNAFVQENPERVKRFSGRLVDLIKSTGGGLLLLTVAIILSGVFLSYATTVGNFAKSFFNRLMSNSDIDVASLATVTIRNVVKGILGVAIIQSALAGAGMMIAGIPYSGIWILLCLILAIVQIGILPVSIGVIIYIWTNGSTTTAIMLTIWMVLVGLLDNFLKPILMGKGAPVPMLVIFMGAIGGFIFSGFIGLFTGAVILSLGYLLFNIWIKGADIK